MNLSRFIARRYLFAKKSHQVINIISIIAATGIAVGCAALVIILSIYNGVGAGVRRPHDSHTPDVLVTPAQGKVFSPDDRFDFLREDPRVKAACGVLEESVFLQYGERNKVVVARGVDSLYEQVTGLRDYLVEGRFELMYGALPQVGRGRGARVRALDRGPGAGGAGALGGAGAGPEDGLPAAGHGLVPQPYEAGGPAQSPGLAPAEAAVSRRHRGAGPGF